MSDSASVSATFTVSWNLYSACLSFFSASRLCTRATSAISDARSTLLQVVFHERRLFRQERHVRVRLLQEPAEVLHRRLEGFGELALLLVAPGGFQPAHAGVQAAHQALQLVVETRQVLGESAQLGGIDIGFGHGVRSPDDRVYPRARREAAAKCAGTGLTYAPLAPARRRRCDQPARIRSSPRTRPSSARWRSAPPRCRAARCRRGRPA